MKYHVAAFGITARERMTAVLLDRHLAEGQPSSAMAHRRPRDQPAGSGSTQEVDLEVGGHRRLALLGLRERDRRQRHVGDRRDRAAVNDGASRGRETMGLGGHRARQHDLAEADLDDLGADVGHHPGGRPHLVELGQRPDAVRVVGHRSRCSSMRGAMSR